MRRQTEQFAYQLVVFDLDFTLWDCGATWVDCTSPPYRQTTQGVIDSQRRRLRLYPDVLAILQQLKDANVPMAIASRTQQPDWARQLMPLLNLTNFFVAEEIYPSSKVRHFASLQKRLGIAYQDMLFFDDEMRNIDEVGALGVKSVWVENGLTWDVFNASISPHY